MPSPGNNGRMTINAPLRGSFPLDVTQKCKEFVDAYIECIQKKVKKSGECEKELNLYLECRKKNDLI